MTSINPLVLEKIFEKLPHGHGRHLGHLTCFVQTFVHPSQGSKQNLALTGQVVPKTVCEIESNTSTDRTDNLKKLDIGIAEPPAQIC